MNRKDKIEEAIARMNMLKLSNYCIDDFREGQVWESEGIGALYELNDEEKKIVRKFQKYYSGTIVYHVIHNMTEFGELYTLLFVSEDETEWKEDKEDIKNGYIFAYVYNKSDTNCSEFGTVYVKPSIGGLVRVY